MQKEASTESRKARPFARPPLGTAVEAVFSTYPAPVKARLLALRRLIFDIADTTEGVGALEETLKWGQPSYLTTESKSGSTVRIDQVKAEADRYAVYFHCQTDLVETFRELYPDLRYGGNRAFFRPGEKRPNKRRPLRRAGIEYHARSGRRIDARSPGRAHPGAITQRTRRMGLRFAPSGLVRLGTSAACGKLQLPCVFKMLTFRLARAG